MPDRQDSPLFPGAAGPDTTAPLPHERWQTTLGELTQLLRWAKEATTIESHTCTLLAQTLRVEQVGYIAVDAGTGLATMRRYSASNGQVSIIECGLSPGLRWAMGIIQQGNSLNVADARVDPSLPPESRTGLADLGIVGWMGTPIIRNGTLVGGLCVSVSTPRHWQPDEIWLVEHVAEQAWAHLLHAFAEQKLQDQNLELQQQAGQLRRLASELTLVEHHTRALLSKALHDGLQQNLYASQFALETAVEQLGPREALLHAKSNLREAIEAARSLSVDLFPPVLHNFGLSDALSWLASWVRRKYGKQVLLKSDAAADPSSLDARILIFESVRELIFNSVKHANSPFIRVESSLAAGDLVCVRVSDEGAGFDAQGTFLAGLTGHSLGLVSIRERLKMLGGTMSVDSQPGAGCRVQICIPRASSLQEQTPSDARTNRVNPPPSLAPRGMDSDKDPLRLLIVDDHPICREGLQALFSARRELRVVGEATNGSEALERVAELEPDAVIMDVLMPVLDGVQATRAIKARFPHIAVFGLSVTPFDSGDAHPIEQAGASGFFSKDGHTQPLLERLLAEHRSRPPRLSPALTS